MTAPLYGVIYPNGQMYFGILFSNKQENFRRWNSILCLIREKFQASMDSLKWCKMRQMPVWNLSQNSTDGGKSTMCPAILRTTVGSKYLRAE